MSEKLILAKIELFQIVITSLTIFLFLEMLERTITMIFVLNFASSPNITVFLGILIANGFLYSIFFSKLWPHFQKFLNFMVGSSTLFICLSLIQNAIFGMISSVLAQFLLLPILIYYLQVIRRKFTLALILGLCFNTLLRIWFDTLSLFANNVGQVLLIVITLIWFSLWFGSNQKNFTPVDANLELIHLYPIYVLLIIEYLILNSASVLSTWYFPDKNIFGLSLLMVFKIRYILINAGILLGLFVGAYLTLKNFFLDKKYYYLSFGIFIISIFDVIYLDLLTVVSIFLAQVTAIVILNFSINFITTTEISQLSLKLGIIQILVVLLMILVIGAGSWAAFPEPLKTILKGRASLFMIVSIYLFPTSTISLYIKPNGGRVNE
ncbi:MAG: hypothetical protein ACXAD7_14925 [Candidatus Kariarchaeaceae archaeon]|jgi:hypothetical protein